MEKHTLIFLATCLVTVYAYDVHKHMTAEELRSTFHVDHHELVPDYEVVHIQQHHVRRKRSIEGSSGGNSIDSDGETNSKFTKRKQFRGGTGNQASDHLTSLKFSAFGKDLNLNLEKNEGLFKKSGLKIWSVEPNATAQHGVEYVELPQDQENIGEIYQDVDNQAAILMRKDENGLVVEGNVGSDLVIRPLPARLRTQETYTPSKPSIVDDDERSTKKVRTSTLPEHDDDEMFLDADGELSAEVAIDTGLPIKRNTENTQQGHQHIVFKRKNAEEDIMSDYAFMEPDHLSKRYRRSLQNITTNSRKKREAPYIIYPEILVIVDYDGYRLHGGDNIQIKRYFISFWNGVDLRYKLLKGPRVRISIAGIIISRGRDATPYLERNRVGRDAIDSAAALTDMGKYLFRERRLPVYDIAVAITKLDMCRRQYAGDVCNRGTAGFAYVGGACVVNKRLEKVNSVAIIEDTGGFSGIIVAAHEVGHLLGAVHDGSPPPSYLGGPGAEKCQWTDGYIMSDLRHTERGFRWSPCSISSFHHFLNGDTASCLFNAPHEDDSLQRVLPGKLLSLDAQCRRDRGTSACFKDDRVCAQLFCFDAGSGYCVAYRPAAEGSPCGDGQYCLNGRCVAEHENIIPDYTQNTPSYIRREGIQSRPLFSDEDEENDKTQPPIYQQQYTTSPFQPKYYTTTKPTSNPYYTSTSNIYYSTTSKPYYYYTSNSYFSSTSKPYVSSTLNSFYTPTTTTTTSTTASTTTSTTQKPTENTTKYKYFFNFYQPSTTKTHLIEEKQTTKNPYIGDYYAIRKSTTKSPYDFANFAKNFQELHNNYLKRSYNVASYFDSTNIRNSSTNFNNQRSAG